MSTTIGLLATSVINHTQTKTRDNGDSFVSLKDDAPEWMSDLMQAAHDGSLPDDHTYAFILEALNAIADHDDADDARDSIESDTYNRDLLTWLSSSLSRASYVNDGVAEFGIDESNFDLFTAIGLGQLTEKRQVFELVLSQIESRLEEIEAA